MSSLILANQFRVQYNTVQSVHMFLVKFIFIFHKIHQQSSSLKRMFNQKNFPLIKYYSCGLKCIGVTPQFHDFRCILNLLSFTLIDNRNLGRFPLPSLGSLKALSYSYHLFHAFYFISESFLWVSWCHGIQ